MLTFVPRSALIGDCFVVEFCDQALCQRECPLPRKESYSGSIQFDDSSGRLRHPHDWIRIMIG